MKKTRIIALLLSALMLTGLFTGCGEKKGTYLTINGEGIDDAMLEASIYSQLQQYLAYGSDAAQLKEMLAQEIDEEGTTVADSLKESIVENIKQMEAIKILAKENNINLSDEEKASVKDQKQQTIDSMGGRAAFVEALEGAHMTEEIYDNDLEATALAQKVFTALFNQGGKFAPSTDSIISDIVDNNVRVRHICIRAASTDEDFAEKQAKAEQILARVTTGGEDFETVLAEMNEDPGMDTYTEGYVFNEAGILATDGSQFDTNFVAASLNLEVGQISQVVQSTSGFHVIKRLPLDEAYVTEHISEYYASYASQAFSDKVMEIVDKMEVEISEEYNNLDVTKFLETESTEATDDGHAHN